MDRRFVSIVWMADKERTNAINIPGAPCIGVGRGENKKVGGPSIFMWEPGLASNQMPDFGMPPGRKGARSWDVLLGSNRRLACDFGQSQPTTQCLTTSSGEIDGWGQEISKHWIEINLIADLGVQDEILLEVLRPYVQRLQEKGVLSTYHFFREPELRFRIRLNSKRAKEAELKVVAKMADSLTKKRLVSSWYFGNHGEKGREYVGEEDRYGVNGWKIAQDYFSNGAEIALRMLALKKEGTLESPLWAKGLGNPWEGGERNPWKEREEDPLVYNWSRYVHLFTNQLGFNVEEEAKLCSRQATRYETISKDLGMKW